CLMKERIAAIWFSCFCCASANLRSMPAAAASSLIDLVFAVRQPLSAPTWENPRVILSDPEPEPESEPESPQAAREARASAAPAAAARILRFIGGSPSRGWDGVLALTSRGGRREVEGGGSGADDGGGTAGAFRRREEGTASGRTGVSPDGGRKPEGGAGRVVVVGDAGVLRQAVRGGHGAGGRVAGDGSTRAAAGPERPLARGRAGLPALPAPRGSPPGGGRTSSRRLAHRASRRTRLAGMFAITRDHVNTRADGRSGQVPAEQGLPHAAGQQRGRSWSGH